MEEGMEETGSLFLVLDWEGTYVVSLEGTGKYRALLTLVLEIGRGTKGGS